MRKAVFLLLLPLLAAAVAAQTATQPRPPYEWKPQGDSPETFKATLVVHQKVDQSTARGVVEAYCGFTDSRDTTRKADRVVRDAWNAVQWKALAPWEEKLLGKEARESLAKARKEETDRDPTKDRSAEPTTITGESEGENGAVLVETLQKTINRAPGKDGQINESVWESRLRFTCRKGDDGKWRIARIERRQRDWSKDDDNAWVWREETGMLSMIYSLLALKAPAEPAEPAQDTPEKAALALYLCLLARETALQTRMLNLAIGPYRDVLEPLFAPELVDKAKAEAEVEQKRSADSPRPASPEVDSVSDGKDGDKVVRLKPVTRWGGRVQMTLRAANGKWQVVEAGVLENVAGMDQGDKYRALANVYDLPRPR
ncbi:MAG: hypothetical protein KJ044_15810 [Planctomycetes bacterium]|nr:hypothetical protein [Planctomycetota bacterium]